MNNVQNIPVEIGDMRVVFSGRLPLRDVFKDEGSYIHSHTCFVNCIASFPEASALYPERLGRSTRAISF